MSFSKAKLARNEAKDIPKPFGHGPPSTHKSFIPKIRSASQPSTARSSQDNLRSKSYCEQMKLEYIAKTDTERRNFGFIRDRSVSKSEKSEDFKDALSTKLSDRALEATSNADLCSKKSSTSAIPIPVKMNSNLSKSSFKSKMPQRTSNFGYSAKTIEKTLSTSPERRSFDAANKRSLEMQFTAKKKRFDAMRKDFLEKQKPIVELYQTLMQLKKKLEENGKSVILESFKIFECETKRITNDACDAQSAGGEHVVNKVNYQQVDSYENLRKMLKNIPTSLFSICMQISERRSTILAAYEKNSVDFMNPTIQQEMDDFKQETSRLDNEMKTVFGEQEQLVDQTVDNWNRLYVEAKNSLSQAGGCLIKQLEAKVRDLELVVKNYEENERGAKMEACESCKDLNNLEVENRHLKDNIKTLEKKLEHDKLSQRKLQDEHHKLKDSDANLKTVKARLKDLETDKQKVDCKVVHLTSELRKAQAQLKQYEQKHDKYRADVEKQLKLDAGVVEKLNKGKSLMETRLSFLQDQLDQQRLDFQSKETALLQELEEMRADTQVQFKSRQHLQTKLEHITQAKSSLEIQAQQAVDLINNKKKPGLQHTGDGLTTDLERHLFTEKVVLETVLKATQDKVDSYTSEKMRFIETMEVLTNSDLDTLSKEVLKRDQKIIKLEEERKRHLEIIDEQKLEIDQANQEIEALKQRLENETATLPKDEEDVRRVLMQGRLKLEQAMKKTLENEQKIIKYESDLAKQTAILVELENLLKVRDGLIGMMKQKKDHLMSENDSLTKYSQGVRAAIFEAHEALSDRAEEVTKLKQALHEKTLLCQATEVRMRELEDTILSSNEKRFKLQDTIGCIEKELQATKAHLKSFDSRYATFGTLPNLKHYKHKLHNTNKPCNTMAPPLARNSEPIRYTNYYPHPSRYQPTALGRRVIYRHKPVNVTSMHNMTKKRTLYNYPVPQMKQSGDDSDRSVSDLSDDDNDSEVVHQIQTTTITSSSRIRNKNDSVVSISSLTTREHRREQFMKALRNNVERTTKLRNEQKQFIDNVNKLSKYDQSATSSKESLGKKPTMLFDGFDRYRVMKNGSLRLCEPTRDMHLSSMMVTKDLIAQSCHKIKRDIDSSLKLLETSCANINQQL